MSHRNPRLTPTGRRIIIERVLAGRPVAHVAKKPGNSWTCAHRWISRYQAHGWDGLEDRSSRPRSCPQATPANVVADVLAQRVAHRAGPTDLAVRCGTSARTVSRIFARAGMPRLWDLDPGPGSGLPGPPAAVMNVTTAPEVLSSLASGLAVSPAAWTEYGEREETRQEHGREIRAYLGMSASGIADFRRPVEHVGDVAAQTDKGIARIWPRSAAVNKERRATSEVLICYAAVSRGHAAVLL